jgi:hypothetical protein
MAETKTIASIYVVTDSDNGYENIGDIDGGGFDEQWLIKHIDAHGVDQLLHKIAYMNWQVFEAMRMVNETREKMNPPKSNS